MLLKDGEVKKQRRCNGPMKDEEKKHNKGDKKGPEEAPKGYIHVRARRGQATDSHSLAERVLITNPPSPSQCPLVYLRP